MPPTFTPATAGPVTTLNSPQPNAAPQAANPVGSGAAAAANNNSQSAANNVAAPANLGNAAGEANSTAGGINDVNNAATGVSGTSIQDNNNQEIALLA